MLVLTRKVGEAIHVPQCDLVFTILEVRGERVRIAIEAPMGVHVYRQELWARLREEVTASETPAAEQPARTA
jgi:carbon storage regulator